jgi:serine O-acetyltransferase
MTQSLMQTLKLIKSDMQTRCDYEHKPLTAFRFFRYLFFSATLVVIIFRFQKFFNCHLLKPLACLLGFVNLFLFTTKIDPSSNIGKGFVVLHPFGIMIGPNVSIGENCILAHQNTICSSPFITDSVTTSSIGPTIGNNIIMGAGACIYGDITLGDNVKVSMNAVVDKNQPDDAVLFGVPAKNVVRKVVAKEAIIA